MAGIFGEFFLVSASHETKHENSSKNSGKIRREIRGKIRDKNSKNSGNFRSATFLTLKSVPVLFFVQWYQIVRGRSHKGLALKGMNSWKQFPDWAVCQLSQGTQHICEGVLHWIWHFAYSILLVHEELRPQRLSPLLAMEPVVVQQRHENNFPITHISRTYAPKICYNMKGSHGVKWISLALLQNKGSFTGFDGMWTPNYQPRNNDYKWKSGDFIPHSLS